MLYRYILHFPPHLLSSNDLLEDFSWEDVRISRFRSLKFLDDKDSWRYFQEEYNVVDIEFLALSLSEEKNLENLGNFENFLEPFFPLFWI